MRNPWRPRGGHKSTRVRSNTQVSPNLWSKRPTTSTKFTCLLLFNIASFTTRWRTRGWVGRWTKRPLDSLNFPHTTQTNTGTVNLISFYSQKTYKISERKDISTVFLMVLFFPMRHLRTEKLILHIFTLEILNYKAKLLTIVLANPIFSPFLTERY